VICLASAIGAAGMGLITLASPANPFPALIAGQAITGLGIALFNLQSLSLPQAITPASVLGRVNAVVRLVGWGTLPVGATLGGWLGGVVGLRPSDRPVRRRLPRHRRLPAVQRGQAAASHPGRGSPLGRRPRRP